MVNFMRKFGTFDLSTTVLGRGSYSCVLLGRDSTVDEEVAVKVVNRTPLLSDPATRQRLGREVTLIQNLKHRCICECRGVFRSQSRFYLVFELCRGGDLHSYVHAAKGAVRLTDALTIFADVLLALDYIHSNFVAHRDVKLENVLLNSDGEAKLCDFGFATVYKPSSLTADKGEGFAAESSGGNIGSEASIGQTMATSADTPLAMALKGDSAAHGLAASESGSSVMPSVTKHSTPQRTLAADAQELSSLRNVWTTAQLSEKIAFLSREEATTRCGSPHYAAPELFTLSSASYNPFAADMWSAGVMLYGLVCGTLPFDVPRSQNRTAMREQLRSLVCKGIYWRPNAPDDVCDLIDRMITVDPTKRLTAREALFHPAMLPYVSHRVAQYGFAPLHLSPKQHHMLTSGGGAPLAQVVAKDASAADVPVGGRSTPTTGRYEQRAVPTVITTPSPGGAGDVEMGKGRAVEQPCGCTHSPHSCSGAGASVPPTVPLLYRGSGDTSSVCGPTSHAGHPQTFGSPLSKTVLHSHPESAMSAPRGAEEDYDHAPLPAPTALRGYADASASKRVSGVDPAVVGTHDVNKYERGLAQAHVPVRPASGAPPAMRSGGALDGAGAPMQEEDESHYQGAMCTDGVMRSRPSKQMMHQVVA